MRSFFLKLILLLLSIFITLTYINKYGLYNSSNYIYAAADKYKRAQALPSPKLILVGGSSLAFGVNSKMLEDSLHMPVVNMGLHAGVGMSFYLSETQLVAKRGDIVVWSFESHGNESAINGEDYYKALLYNAVPEIYEKLSLTNKIDFLELKYFYFSRINKELQSINDHSTKAPLFLRWLSNISIILPGKFYTDKVDSSKFVYERKAFNTYGDVYTHLYLKPEKPFKSDSGSDVELGESSKTEKAIMEEVRLMNDAADELKEKGITIYYFFPSTAQSLFQPRKSSFDSLQSSYKRMLHLHILNSMTEAVYPDSLFYNTCFHLNKYGREQNTEKLLIHLRANLRG